MAYLCRAWENSCDFTIDMLKCNTKHTNINFALVVFAVGHLLKLALVTTSPSLPYPCPECGRVLQDRIGLINHFRTNRVNQTWHHHHHRIRYGHHRKRWMNNSILFRDLSGWAQDMLTATLYSCWSRVNTMMPCHAPLILCYTCTVEPFLGDQPFCRQKRSLKTGGLS